MIRGDATTRLLLDLESSKRNMFVTSDAAKVLEVPKVAVNRLLHRLVKKGRIYRVERGKYALIPAEAGTEGMWMELPEVIGWRLVEPSYIGFAEALFYWDMTEQKPSVTHVVTTKRKKDIRYECYEFQFVTMDPKRFFGQTTVTLEDQPVVISDREKTIVDCTLRPRYCGSLDEVAKGLFGIWDDINAAKMFEYAERIGVQAVKSRLLYLLDMLGLDAPDVPNVSKSDAEKSPDNRNRAGYSWLDPAWPKTVLGYSKEHRLIINRDKKSLMRWYGH